MSNILSPREAVAKAKTITKGYKGLCLQFVRTCYNIPAKYPSAASAWSNAKKKHRTADVRDCPVGYPMFFSIPGNSFGHVAIAVGGGMFRTNYSAKGTVITAPFNHAVFAGMKPLGWTEDLNGVNLGKPSAGDDEKADPKIKKWQQSMNKIFPAYAKFAPDGKYGPYSAQVTKEFQARVGLPQTGKLDAKTVELMKANGVKW